MRTLCLTLVAALIALAAGPLSPASADGPDVTIGSPASGTETNERTQLFSGSSSDTLDPVTLKIFEGVGTGGAQLPALEPAIPVGDAWSVRSAPLADGVYTAVAEQEDSGTLENGYSNEVTLTVDTTAPTVTLGSVLTPTRNPNPSFTGSASEMPGDDSNVSVVVYAGSAVGGKVEDSGSAPVSGGAWSFTSSSLPDGSYTVQAEQADTAGNVAKTSAATFRVDTSAPTLSITMPNGGDNLKSSRPTFGGSTGDAPGDSMSVAVEIFNGESVSETPAQALTVERSGSSWTTGSSGPRLPNGVYTVRAWQFDSVGNRGQSSPVTFTIDSPSPVVTLNALSRFIGYTSPAFSGSAQAPEAEPSVTLRIWHGTSASGKLVESASAPVSAGAWSVPPVPALAEGTYTAQVEQAGVTSNPPGVSAASTFTVDTTAPHPTLSATGESTGLETVSGLAGVAPGDRKQVTAELFQGPAGEPAQAFETITVNVKTDGAEGVWSATFAGLPSGEYTVLARQSDEAGNPGASQAQSFTVVAPSPGATVTPVAASPPLASFTWVPANPAVGERVSLASNSSGGSSLLSGFAWDVGTGQFAPAGPSLSTSFAVPGPHVVRLQVTDANGLSSIATHTIGVAAQALKLMQPFPIVRIAGSETSSGSRIKLLSVQAPPATRVAVSCKGPGCKTRAESRLATASSKSRSKAGAIVLAFPRFQRALRTGAVLQIRVSKAGEIGKFTSFTIRRNKLPTRIDACLRPTSSRPTPCPSP